MIDKKTNWILVALHILALPLAIFMACVKNEVLTTIALIVICVCFIVNLVIAIIKTVKHNEKR